MALNEKQLLDIKSEIDESKQKLSRLEGEKDALMKTLKTEFDCDSLEQLEMVLDKTEKRLVKISEFIKEKTEELEEKYFEKED